MVGAVARRQAREQALQAQAIRMAVWSEPDALADYLARLTGDTRGASVSGNDRDAALAAFGLRLMD